MEIREYRPEDCQAMAELFYHTVHTVNKRDYSQPQLDAWASGNVDMEMWDRSFKAHETLVAVEGTVVVGFGDMDESGYLDHLYVHKDYQGRGIATAICDRLEGKIRSERRQTHCERQQTHCERYRTHASITARPFFEKRGYRVVKEQQVERNGVWLTNFMMEKQVERMRQ